MTVSVEIIAERIPDTLFIPLEALFTKDGKPTVYIRDGDDYEPRTVTVGEENDNYVIVREGLVEDEEVALFDPTLGPAGRLETGSRSEQQGPPPTSRIGDH
jgi:multidrug efflux pump subunit AcrA (membrane-fusion protein)